MNNSERSEFNERDEIVALLPWYVAGKLDSASCEQVERYLESHPEDLVHLELAREEMDATVAANQAIQAPGPEALDRLRASVAALPRRKSALAQLREHLMDWLSALEPPQLALASAAAAVILLFQAAIIGGLLLERSSGPAYQTASGDETVPEGAELLVGFAEGATAGQISALLQELDATLVDGPRSGLYRLRIAKGAGESREDAVKLLEKSGLVTIVLPGG